MGELLPMPLGEAVEALALLELLREGCQVLKGSLEDIFETPDGAEVIVRDLITVTNLDDVLAIGTLVIKLFGWSDVAVHMIGVVDAAVVLSGCELAVPEVEESESSVSVFVEDGSGSIVCEGTSPLIVRDVSGSELPVEAGDSETQDAVEVKLSGPSVEDGSGSIVCEELSPLAVEEVSVSELLVGAGDPVTEISIAVKLLMSSVEDGSGSIVCEGISPLTVEAVSESEVPVGVGDPVTEIPVEIELSGSVSVEDGSASVVCEGMS